MTSAPIELVPDRLYRLGGTVPLDGRITWAPKDQVGFEPVSCYLLKEGDKCLLIETGVALHADEVLEQLDTIMPRGSSLSLFLTRMEPDSLSSLGSLLANYNVDHFHAGGAANAFDFFDDINTSDMVEANFRVRPSRKMPGDSVELSPTRSIEVIRTPLRMLSTFWLYDEATKTMFTSDSFGFYAVDSPDQPPVVTTAASGPEAAAWVKKHVLTKLDYLKGARTESIVEVLKEIFAIHDVDRIAPTHGSVLEGKDVVDANVELLLASLVSAGQDQSLNLDMAIEISKGRQQ